MVTILVPVIQETDTLVLCHRAEKAAYLGVAVYRHLLRVKRMCKGIVRIILPRVFLFNDQVGYQIENKPGIIPEALSKHWHQLVLIQHFPDNGTGPDFQAAASVSEGKFFGELCIREIDLELLVRKH